MKRINLIKFLFVNAIFSCLGVNYSIGQSFQDNNIDILGPRLFVESPSGISGFKDFTYSTDPDLSGPWGGSLGIFNHEEVVKAVDTEACSTVTGVAGKWALIYRGNCEFGAKALHAQQAGAIGVIIWNHTPNELVNMGAGAQGINVTIPVLFISNADGRAITNQLSNGQQVFISISPWSFGNTHDLAFAKGSHAVSPGMAIPITQFNGTDVPEYRGYTGAVVANTGTSDETNVKVNSVVTFTPQGGSSTPFYKDSAILASFPVADSVKFLFSSDNFQFNPSQLGTYNFSYSLSADNVDQFQGDNNMNFNFDITSNVFCRGRYDNANQEPVVTGFTRVGGTQSCTWGPMFYNNVGGYQLQTLKFALKDQDTSEHSLVTSAGGSFIDAYVFKWVDLNTDGFMQGNELDLKGTAIAEFTITDSNGTMLTANIGNPSDGTPTQIVSDDSSHYWVAFNLGTEFSLSVDRSINYTLREVAAAHGTNTSHDFWAPAIFKRKEDIVSNDTVRLIPYGVINDFSNNIDSASYVQQEAIPAVALYTSLFPVSVKTINSSSNSKFSVYPNPATDKVTIDFEQSEAQNTYLKIIDALGRQVYVERLGKIKGQSISVPVSSLAPGSYYVILISNGKALARQFSVQ